MPRKTSAGAIVVNADNKIPLVYQFENSWSFPKGGFNPQIDSSIRDAAVRKVFEETGIPEMHLDFVQEFTPYTRPGLRASDNLEITIHMFHFRTDYTGQLRPISKDITKAEWVDPYRVDSFLTHPLDKKFYQSALKELFLK